MGREERGREGRGEEGMEREERGYCSRIGLEYYSVAVAGFLNAFLLYVEFVVRSLCSHGSKNPGFF